MGSKMLYIFDFDGTIADTNEVNFFSYKEALKNYNYKLTYEIFMKLISSKDFKNALYDINKNLINFYEEIHNQKINNYKKYLYKIKPNSTLINLLKELHDNNYIAIVSTASRENLIRALDFLNLTNFIDLIIAKEDVNEVKPDPEGFLKACDYFNMKKKDVLVFEDSDIGVTASKRAKLNYCHLNYFRYE